MKPADLKKIIDTLDPDKDILCQVVAKDGKAWNMYFELHDVKNCSFNVLMITHPELETLPTFPT